MAGALGLQATPPPTGRTRCAWSSWPTRATNPTTWCCSTGRCPAWTASSARACWRQRKRAPPDAHGADADRLQPRRGAAAPGRAAAQRWRAADQAGHAVDAARCLPAALGWRRSMPATRATQREEACWPPRRLSGARILLVEDNAINRELALDLLSRAGIVVSRSPRNGQEALDMLGRAAFRRRADGLPDAGHGRLRRDPRCARPRSGATCR
jgi:hypothetical protein